MDSNKLISAVCAVSLTANLLFPATSSATDSENPITFSDLKLMQDYLLNNTSVDIEKYRQFDMNGDSSTDVFDFVLMKQQFIANGMPIEYTAETEHFSVGYKENIYRTSPSNNAVAVTSLQELTSYLSQFFVDDIVKMYVQKYNAVFFENNVLLLNAFWYTYIDTTTVTVNSLDCMNDSLNVSVKLKTPAIDDDTAFETEALVTQITVPKSEYIGLPLKWSFSVEELPRQDPPENKKILDVKNILQNPELPTGCEVTSLTILLNYLGYPAEKVTMSRNYLPKQDFYWNNGIYYGADFRTTFAGNPESSYSYGCYAPCIVTTANNYFSANGFDSAACDITGADFDSLLTDYIDNDIPLCIWITSSNLHASTLTSIWTTPNGEQVQWRAYEHCVVLTGYDKDNQLIYVADPLYGSVSYDYNTIRQRYIELGQQAVYIIAK